MSRNSRNHIRDKIKELRVKRKSASFFYPFFFSSFLFALFSLLCCSGCGPKYTYPADGVAKSVEDICRKENQLTVKGLVNGKTLGAIIYVNDLTDVKGQVPKEIHEKMGQIMQAVTRVSLSTDLPLDFCTVVIRDRKHQNELTVTRSLDDTKRANSEAIGMEESMNRTLFGQGRYPLGAKDADTFVLKDVKLEDFLAEQIAQRIRFSFLKEDKETLDDTLDKEELANQQAFVFVDGFFEHVPGAGHFRFSVLSLKPTEARETILSVFHVVNEVLKGYHFENFKDIEMLDYVNRQKMLVDEKTLAQYQAKKINDQYLLDHCMS